MNPGLKMANQECSKRRPNGRLNRRNLKPCKPKVVKRAVSMRSLVVRTYPTTDKIEELIY